MAVHKVPQDVEAEDKFLGPLTFKQFLFGGGVVVFGYLTYITIAAGGWFVSFIFAIPALIFAALAFPWSKEQPTELWLAAQIRFRIKPRKRIWDQSGMKDLVTITAPVRIAHAYSDGLTQNEVRTRLSALATMVDSRGWAVKNVRPDEESDRLVQATVTAPDENEALLNATPDVFDEKNSTIAKQFDTIIEKSEQQHKSETMRLIEEARKKSTETVAQQDYSQPQSPGSGNSGPGNQTQDFWFMHTPAQPADPTLATFQSNPVVTPGTTATVQPLVDDSTVTTDLSEEELLEKAHKKHERDAMQTISRHERVIDPHGQQTPPAKKPDNPPQPNQTISTMTPPTNPDILNLAQSNDLSVETLARQANKKKDFGDDEVVISLH